MKRSEMLSKLEDYFGHALYLLGDDRSHHAKKMLELIERMGMRPPVNPLQYSVSVYEWEPEVDSNDIKVGEVVYFEGKKYTVLGFAQTPDKDGRPFIELTWNDFLVSPTGYLAVPRYKLERVK